MLNPYPILRQDQNQTLWYFPLLKLSGRMPERIRTQFSDVKTLRNVQVPSSVLSNGRERSFHHRHASNMRSLH